MVLKWKSLEIIEGREVFQGRLCPGFKVTFSTPTTLCLILNQSFHKVLYHIVICLDKATAAILAAQCLCPALKWPSTACSHVAATLFAIEYHVVHSWESDTCISRLHCWQKPSLCQQNPIAICDATFRKVTGNLGERPHKEPVLHPRVNMTHYRKTCELWSFWWIQTGLGKGWFQVWMATTDHSSKQNHTSRTVCPVSSYKGTARNCLLNRAQNTCYVRWSCTWTWATN